MKTIVAIIGDSHADQDSRFDEHDTIMHWIGEDAARRGVTLFQHAGDVWERRSSSKERIAVADWARSWTENAPLVVVAGNHDDPLDIEWMGRLRTQHQIYALTRPDVIDVAGCTVACMPWPDRGHLRAALKAGTTKEIADQAAKFAMQDILRGMGTHEATGPRIFLGHCMMRGSRVSMSQPPLVGCEFELGTEDLALVKASFYALGHIHLGVGNEWDVAGAPAAYPGSPRRCNFGEIDPKGYILAEFDGDKLVHWERIETPCAKMLHVSGGWNGESMVVDDVVPNIVGVELRFRFMVAVDQREAANNAADRLRDTWITGGAKSVKLEERIMTVSKTRAPEVAKAYAVRDKLLAYWQTIDFTPGDRLDSLLEKATELEEQVRLESKGDTNANA